jgi:hypothetical protein
MGGVGTKGAGESLSPSALPPFFNKDRGRETASFRPSLWVRPQPGTTATPCFRAMMRYRSAQSHLVSSWRPALVVRIPRHFFCGAVRDCLTLPKSSEDKNKDLIYLSVTPRLRTAHFNVSRLRVEDRQLNITVHVEDFSLFVFSHKDSN